MSAELPKADGYGRLLLEDSLEAFPNPAEEPPLVIRDPSPATPRVYQPEPYTVRLRDHSEAVLAQFAAAWEAVMQQSEGDQALGGLRAPSLVQIRITVRHHDSANLIVSQPHVWLDAGVWDRAVSQELTAREDRIAESLPPPASFPPDGVILPGEPPLPLV